MKELHKELPQRLIRPGAQQQQADTKAFQAGGGERR